MNLHDIQPTLPQLDRYHWYIMQLRSVYEEQGHVRGFGNLTHAGIEYRVDVLLPGWVPNDIEYVNREIEQYGRYDWSQRGDVLQRQIRQP